MFRRETACEEEVRAVSVSWAALWLGPVLIWTRSRPATISESWGHGARPLGSGGNSAF